MKAVSLQCNYRVNPLGIDDLTPRLSWICQGGKKQSAYQIEIPSNRRDVEDPPVEAIPIC
jgi:alpha-L-rhamnosidase